MRIGASAVLLLAISGCAADEVGGDDTGPGGKGDGETCVDPMYGDGVCQLDLACGIPDVDCFVTFPDDAMAAAWFAPQDTHPVITDVTDARWIRTRALVDRAWDTFKASVHMGKLADAPLSLVLIDNPETNAFVMSDFTTGKAALSIQVQTGLFVDGLTDEEILGVLYHELEHLHGLHVLAEVPDRLRRYYLATNGEPIGKTQADNPALRTQVEAWRRIAGFVGPFHGAGLGELPVSGNLGVMFSELLQTFSTVHASGACATELAAVQVMRADVGAAYNELDQTLPIDGALATKIRTALNAFGTCAALHPWSFDQFLTEVMGQEWFDYVGTELAADEAWLRPESAFEVITLLADDRYTKARAIEAQVARDLGPWSAVRYYSYEEAADDMSVRVTQAAHYDTIGVSGLMLRILTDAQRTACEQAIAAKRVPYGTNLADEHHGTCWRVAHARQLAATGTARAAFDVRSPHVAALPKVARRIY